MEQAASCTEHRSFDLYPSPTQHLAQRRRELAPDISEAFEGFGKAVFAAGALSPKMKQIIAVAAAHVTQCPYCIKGHTASALRAGASAQELMEAIWVAAEMRAGAAFAHSLIALAEIGGAAPPDGLSPKSTMTGVLHGH
jgi:AhpD family alkylhydroperoxidase